MENWGLSDKFTIIAGDICFPHEGIGGSFDLVTLYNVLHYFTPEKRIEFNRDFVQCYPLMAQ